MLQNLITISHTVNKKRREVQSADITRKGKLLLVYMCAHKHSSHTVNKKREVQSADITRKGKLLLVYMCAHKHSSTISKKMEPLKCLLSLLLIETLSPGSSHSAFHVPHCSL